MKPPGPYNKYVPATVYAATAFDAAVAPIIHVTRLLAPEVSNSAGVYVYEAQEEHVS